MRILVIEDDFVSRTLLHRLLESFGETTAVGSGEQGLATFAAANAAGTPFDLVTLDVMLPGSDGFAVLQQLRQQEAATPAGARSKVLMTTARDDVKSVATAYASLCDDYLTKPIRRSTLFDKLQSLGFGPR